MHPRCCVLQQEKPLQREAHSLQLKKSLHSSEDPAQPHISKYNFIFFKKQLENGLRVGAAVLKLRGSKEVHIWKQEVGVGQSVTIKGAYKWSN